MIKTMIRIRTCVTSVPNVHRWEQVRIYIISWVKLTVWSANTYAHAHICLGKSAIYIYIRICTIHIYIYMYILMYVKKYDICIYIYVRNRVDGHIQ
jgi:hypothetical protein